MTEVATHEPVTQLEIDQREFLLRAGVLTVGGLAMAKLAWERTVAFFRKNLA